MTTLALIGAGAIGSQGTKALRSVLAYHLLARATALVTGALLVACQPASAGAPSGPVGPTRAGMVLVPGGRFQPGGVMSQNAWITVDSFFLDETEVTAAAYAACVHAGRCDAQNVTSTTGSGTSLVPNAACNYGVAGRQDHPMNCVDWPEADAYCRARGTRLPTNDEWEWAARSAAVLEKMPIDKQGSSPWEGADSAFQPCWSARDRRTGTCVVGSNPAGDPPVGPKDLAGNVSEWTAAHQRRTGSTSPTSIDSVPVAPDLELMWGGSWENNGPSSYHPFPKVYRFASTGFRCAK